MMVNSKFWVYAKMVIHPENLEVHQLLFAGMMKARYVQC